MNGRRAYGPSAHPRLTWGLFAVVSAIALVIGLASAIGSGGRVTIVMTIWGVLVSVACASAVLHLIMTPLPNESERWGSASSGRGAGSSGWAVGGGGCGGGFGDGGGCS